MLDTLTSDTTDHLAELARAVQASGYHFVTPTPATIARVNGRAGATTAATMRDVFGWSRPFSPALLPGSVLAALEAAGAAEPAGDGLQRSTVRLSSLEGMLFLHSAYPTAAPDSVFFGPDTYRFAQAILPHLHSPIRRAVDIGCGAGPGAILIARAQPTAEVLAVDINPKALMLTAANAAVAGVAVRPVHSDLLSAVSGEFDLIVANPPYLVDPAQRTYRHGGGAFGAELSLAILDAAQSRLAPGGRLVLYTGAAIVDGDDPFFEAASQALGGSGLDWAYREVDPDVFGEELEHSPYDAAERIAAVVLDIRKP